MKITKKILMPALFAAAAFLFAGVCASHRAFADGKLVYGKYGCTASKYRNGSYEYIPRGSFVITANGKYTYNGFEQPSKGSITVDEKGGIHFKDGYLDGGEATPIDRPNKFFLVFPANPDNRWTYGLID